MINDPKNFWRPVALGGSKRKIFADLDSPRWEGADYVFWWKNFDEKVKMGYKPYKRPKMALYKAIVIKKHVSHLCNFYFKD